MNILMVALAILLSGSSVEVEDSQNISSLQPYGIYQSRITCSFYGEVFHGRPTASGEIFNMYAYTCASPHLPLGTRLLCYREGHYKTIRVNDRGPFATNERGYAIWPLRPHPTRRLDLSYQSFVYFFEDPAIGVGSVQILAVEFPE